VDTDTVRGIFPVLPKQAAEPCFVACASRFSSHEPQGKNWVSPEEAADNFGETADEATEDALKVE
jgi:hypothetical protein